MGRKKGQPYGGGTWGFAWRFLLSAVVTAGVVTLVRDFLWSRPAQANNPAPVPRNLPTLPPVSGVDASRAGRLLRHIGGFCVRAEDFEPQQAESSQLILTDCSDGAGPGVRSAFLVPVPSIGSGHEEFQIRVGESCAVPDDREGREPRLAFPVDCAKKGRQVFFRKLVVGTDLFLLQTPDTQKCVAPVGGKERSPDGTRLTIQTDCSRGKEGLRFQTSSSGAPTAVSLPVVNHLATSEFHQVSASPGVPASPVMPMPEVQPAAPPSSAVATPGSGRADRKDDVLIHSSGRCIKAADTSTSEDDTVLVFGDCDDEPDKVIHFVATGVEDGQFRFQLGSQCAHPEDGSEAAAEPRMAFPSSCDSKKHHFTYQKFDEDDTQEGFVLQTAGAEETTCIHPLGGSETPPDGAELINHRDCDMSRKALRWKVGNPWAKDQAPPEKKKKKKKVLGNPDITPEKSAPCSYYGGGRSQSSRPGKPCLPSADFWPYTGITEWRTELAKRAVAAVTPGPQVAEATCGGYWLFGDQTWCNKAFDGSHGYGVVGLSFGIEERDIWSELITQKFNLPVKLFDCFIPLDRSPPMAGKIPNGTAKGAKCLKNPDGDPKLDKICYSNTYEPHRECLAGQQVKIDGRKFGTLKAQLAPYTKLSVHLKIDVEGSEWDVLEWMIENPDEWDKVRTLDMEIHFGFGSSAELPQYKGLDDQAKLERQVKIMEGLVAGRFHCTGSTLEVYRQGWAPKDNCGHKPCGEPPVYLPGGFSVTAFAVSYVHRDLVL